jgi:predicted HicB family RNase H-like nuclease
MKTLTLRLSEETHRELKILSATTGISMSELLMKAIQIITRQKGVRETSFAEAYQQLLTAESSEKLRRYTKKQLDEFTHEDQI